MKAEGTAQTTVRVTVVLLVARTHVAVGAKAMSTTTQSVLIPTGACSVLLMPVLAAITQSRTRTSDLDPDDPEDIGGSALVIEQATGSEGEAGTR